MEDVITEISLVLRSQIDTPINFIFKYNSLCNTFQKNLNSFSIGSPCERPLDKFFKILNMPFFGFLEKLEIFFAVLQNKPNTELNICFSTFHHIKDISKCKFRLNHPKLSNMSASVRHLSSECRTKCINIGKSTRKVLDS